MKNREQARKLGRGAFWVLAVWAGLGAAGCGGRRGGAEGPALLEEGLAALQQGEYRKAARRLDAAANDLASATAFCNLGIACWKLGEKDKAIEKLRLAADLETTNAVPLEWLGQVQMSLRRWNEARESFQRAQQISGETPRSLTSLAVVEYHTGENRNTALLLRKALDLDPNYAPALYNLGILYRDRLKDRKEALKYFQRYLALEPRDAHAVKLRTELARLGIGPAAASGAAGRQGGSQGSGVRGQEAGGGPAAEQGRAQVSRGTPAPAVRAATARPVDPAVAKARAAVRRDALDEALEILKGAVRKDPRNPDALWELATLYDRNVGNAAKASQLYRQFKESFPNDPRCRDIPAAPAASRSRPARRR